MIANSTVVLTLQASRMLSILICPSSLKTTCIVLAELAAVALPESRCRSLQIAMPCISRKLSNTLANVSMHTPLPAWSQNSSRVQLLLVAAAMVHHVTTRQTAVMALRVMIAVVRVSNVVKDSHTIVLARIIQIHVQAM